MPAIDDEKSKMDARFWIAHSLLLVGSENGTPKRQKKNVE